jgi:hypothetical protein
LESYFETLDSCAHSAASVPLGITNPPKGKAEPLRFAPASIGGKTDPKEIASIGSSLWVSIQRPNHPLLMCFAGDAVCHFAIEEKCE